LIMILFNACVLTETQVYVVTWYYLLRTGFYNKMSVSLLGNQKQTH
jgi:hypothetical protein